MNDRTKVTDLVREQDERVSVHGRAETCSYVILKTRNRLSPGTYLSHLARHDSSEFLEAVTFIYKRNYITIKTEQRPIGETLQINTRVC
jgi:hypothetical protein